MDNQYFIAIYTNKVKEYCDEKFFERVYALSKGNPVHVVDNTIGDTYFNKLRELCKSYDNFNIHHIDIIKEPKLTQFQRNVSESANYLRSIFLKTNIHNFLIIESDVLPPINLLDTFSNTNLQEDAGALGALYYQGFHDYKKTGIQKTHHILSGCTSYIRELIEKYPFRWSHENLGAFPDAWISYDSGKEFGLYNNHDIICEHMHRKNGSRYSYSL